MGAGWRKCPNLPVSWPMVLGKWKRSPRLKLWRIGCWKITARLNPSLHGRPPRRPSSGSQEVWLVGSSPTMECGGMDVSQWRDKLYLNFNSLSLHFFEQLFKPQKVDFKKFRYFVRTNDSEGVWWFSRIYLPCHKRVPQSIKIVSVPVWCSQFGKKRNEKIFLGFPTFGIQDYLFHNRNIPIRSLSTAS